MIRDMRSARHLPSLSAGSAALAAGFSLALSLAGCGDAGTGTSSDWHSGSTGGQSGASGVPQGNQASSTGGGSSGTTSTGGGGGGGTGGSGSDAGSSGGGGGDAAGNPQPQGAFDVQLSDAAPSVELRASADVMVTVAPTNFTGTVTLSTTGLPADVTAAFDHPSLSVGGGAGATAKLTLTTLSSTQIAAVPFTVVATSGSEVKNASVTLTVQPVLTITIPVNADANQGTTSNPRKDAFGSYPITISAPPSFPVTINILNGDSTPHEIHAGDPLAGFPHGSGPIAPGKLDTPRNVTQSGTYNFYLHDQNAATTVGRIVIQ